MSEATIQDVAAMNRIVGRLASLVSKKEIDDVAAQFGLATEGTSRDDRILDLIETLWRDGRRRTNAVSSAIAMITMAAHRRFSARKNQMTEDDVDDIVKDMRAMGLDPGDLTRKKWRAGLPRRVAIHTAPPPNTISHSSNRRPPRVYDTALKRIKELITDPAISPSQRGYELQVLVFEVLKGEHLLPLYDVRIPGEQIDMAFTLEGHHYLLECVWEQHPMGLPMVRELRDKVATRAVGTFGVLLSMSGFTAGINATATRGAPLNSIGLSHGQFMAVLEGRRTWSDLISAARAQASAKSVFWAENL